LSSLVGVVALENGWKGKCDTKAHCPVIRPQLSFVRSRSAGTRAECWLTACSLQRSILVLLGPGDHEPGSQVSTSSHHAVPWIVHVLLLACDCPSASTVLVHPHCGGYRWCIDRFAIDGTRLRHGIDASWQNERRQAAIDVSVIQSNSQPGSRGGGKKGNHGVDLFLDWGHGWLATVGLVLSH
jgi:hypothetical protein